MKMRSLLATLDFLVAYSLAGSIRRPSCHMLERWHWDFTAYTAMT